MRRPAWRNIVGDTIAADILSWFLRKIVYVRLLLTHLRACADDHAARSVFRMVSSTLVLPDNEGHPHVRLVSWVASSRLIGQRCQKAGYITSLVTRRRAEYAALTARPCAYRRVSKTLSGCDRHVLAILCASLSCVRKAEASRNAVHLQTPLSVMRRTVRLKARRMSFFLFLFPHATASLDGECAPRASDIPSPTRRLGQTIFVR